MKKFYVTTPIYYVNDVPHIGHAYTTVAADVLARWRRLWGDDVWFVTGTDEHGQKIVQTAKERGVSPRELADETAPRFREAFDSLDITYSDFLRTTEPRHYETVTQILNTVHETGDVYLDKYEGLYCVACEAYYAESDLVNGNCPVHGRPVEKMQEENYFFALSKYQDRLLEHYAAHPEAVRPESRLNEVLGFINQGLQDFSISRTSIDWGVPIPWDPKHVTYVWFDALTFYCTSVGFPSDRARFEHYWPPDVQLMGKDILRFHAVYWPAMLMAAGEEPPKSVFAHGWLLVGGEKMSKSKLNQIAPADLVADFGSDGFRYHFMVDQKFGPDGDFSYEAMVARYNSDLANNFGNLANRVLNMAMNYCGGVVPAVREDGVLAEQSVQAVTEWNERLGDVDFSGAFGAVWELIRSANSFIEDRQPWALFKAGDTEQTQRVIGDCLETLRIVGLLAFPVIPRAATHLWQRLGLGSPEDARLPDATNWGCLPSGNQLEKGEPLFPRFDVD